MLKISKLTDYALNILCELNTDSVISAKILSELTHVPFATTNKILKKLVNANICKSTNGKYGGFTLIMNKDNISLYLIAVSIEDNNSISLTECNNKVKPCILLNKCKINNQMNIIDKEIYNILNNKFISDLIPQ